jgi:hypothetical protein
MFVEKRESGTYQQSSIFQKYSLKNQFILEGEIRFMSKMQN